MPEGPEVKKLVDSLQYYINKPVNKIEVLSGRYTKSPILYLDELNRHMELSSMFSTIEEVNCKGKFIWWKVKIHVGQIREWYLFSTLGMTGGYSKEEDKYSRIKFTFPMYENGKYLRSDYLYYTDMRNFGTMKIVKNRSELEQKLSSLGPDMLSNPCTLEEWLKICEKRKNNTLVKFLMEQKNISGVGNIYKSESLYLARLNPAKSIKECSQEELERLYKSVKIVLSNAYRLGGSTIASYKDLNNNLGKYTKKQVSQEELIRIRDGQKFNHAEQQYEDMSGVMVYNQTVDPFGNPIEKIKLNDQRTTYFVPSVQS